MGDRLQKLKLLHSIIIHNEGNGLDLHHTVKMAVKMGFKPIAR